MKRSLFPLIVFVFVAAAQAQNASAEFVKGNQFFDQKNYVAAAEAYSRCIGYDPNHASCYMNRGLARQIGIGYGLALDDFTKLISIRPDAKAYRLRGGVYNSLKRYNDAIADFNSSLRLNPRESMAYQGRGSSYEKLGDTEKAIADYSQAIASNPSYGPSYKSRAWLYKQTKRFDAAIADYTKAISINPNDDYAYMVRGEIYFDQGKTDAAEADFKRAVELDPKNQTMVKSLKTLASSRAVLAKMGARTNGSATPAPKPSPSTAVPATLHKTVDQYLASGRSLAQAGKHAEAINEYTQAKHLAPTNGLINFYRALSLTSLGRKDEAIRDYNEVIRLNVSLKEATFNRGTLYYERGDYNLALADLNRSIQIDATRWNVFYNRGLTHYQLGDMNKALGDFNKTIELSPRYSSAFVMRAQIYCKQLLTDAAKKDEAAAISLGGKVNRPCGT